MKSVVSEKSVMIEVKAWLKLKGFLFYRMNTGASFYIDRYGKTRFVTFGHKGMADLMVLHEGRAIFLELKASNGKQTFDQRDFQSDVDFAGCSYSIIRSSRDVEDLFNEIGIKFR